MRAFVLMPFGPDFDPVFAGLIQPALVDAGFEVTRADLSTNQQQILKDIVNMLAEADLVIADVTGLNGNVMYELGLAHGMGRRTVMITRDVSELPFDLRSYRATEYSTQFTEADQLKIRLSEIAIGVVDGSAEFSNPILDFAPDFIGRSEQVSIPPRPSSALANDEGDVVPEAEPELGLIDYSIQLTESNEALQEHVGNLTEATRLIGDQVQARSEQLNRTNKNLGSKAAPVIRTIMRDTATEFNSFADDLEKVNPAIIAELKRVGASANGLARMRAGSTPEEKELIQKDIDAFEAAEASFAEAFSNVMNFADTLAALPNMEQNLTAAVRRATGAVSDTAGAIELGRSEFARVRGLLQERLA